MDTISNRLKEIIDICDNANTIADIGSDHAYVPICLIKTKKAKKIIATDKNKGPLIIAKNNIDDANVSMFIELRHGEGLFPLKQNEADEIIISGMGGMLIIDILKKGSVKIKHGATLILSPHKDVCAVRYFLHESDYKISEERMVYEDCKYYNIIKASKGTEQYEHDYEYLFGKLLIDEKNAILKSYINTNISNFTKIHNDLLENNVCSEKLTEINDKINLNKKVLKLL